MHDALTRTRPRWAAALILTTALALAACSSSDDDAAPPPTLPGGEGIEAPTTTIPVPPLLEETPEFDPGTDALVATLTAQVELTDEQRTCVAAELDEDQGLREALGEDAAASERWADVMDLAGDCITTVSFSAEFALSQQRANEGRLTEEQLGCLRRGMAAFSADEIRHMLDGAMQPERRDAELDGRVRALIEGCGVAVVEMPVS